MKKLSLLIVVAFCTGLLLSSCSKLENISVSKRHYRGGYYVDLGTAKQDASPTHNTSKTVTPAVTAPVRSVTADNGAVAAEKQIRVTPPVALSPQAAKKKHVAKAEPVYAATQSAAEVRAAAKAEKLDKQVASLLEQDTASSTSGSDVPEWLLIVLCLIPPLAVGLKFGIIDKFWISVVLTILFWIPGVIYALIVVTQK